MHFPILRAAREGGNGFAGVQQSSRIEGPLDRKEGRSLTRRKLYAHRIDFFDADAVLTGDGAAQLHTELQDFRTETICALPLAGYVGIEQDEGMQVAISGVKDVHAPQTVGLLHPLDGL